MKYRIRTYPNYDGTPKYRIEQRIFFIWREILDTSILNCAEDYMKEIIAKANFKSEIVKEYEV